MASGKIGVCPRFSRFSLAALLLGATLAHAQDPAASYPSRTIRIFGQGTGSTADYLSRYLAQRLQERWGQPVIVDSRAGAGGTIPAGLGGEVPVSFLSPLTAHGQLKAGKVKALAVSSSTRCQGAPDVPSAEEAGIAGMEVKLWFGLFAPAKTPRAVVGK